MKKHMPEIIGSFLGVGVIGLSAVIFMLTYKTVDYSTFAWPFMIIMLVISGVLILALKWREKNKHWKGVVTEKVFTELHISTPKDGTTEEYNIHAGNYIRGLPNSGVSPPNFFVKVKTDEGKELTCSVSAQLYQDVKVGDLLLKHPGITQPVIDTPETSIVTTPSKV